MSEGAHASGPSDHMRERVSGARLRLWMLMDAGARRNEAGARARSAGLFNFPSKLETLNRSAACFFIAAFLPNNPA